MPAPRAALASFLLFAGCGIAGREPGWVHWTPEAPPPERAELHDSPPERGQAWVAGRWIHTNSGWDWQRGRFETPPQPEAIWIPGRWVEKSGQWAWVDGGWR